MFTKYQRLLTSFGALITWLTIIAQLILIIQNPAEPLIDAVIRFFSFFTILTNILVALFFTAMLLPNTRLFAFFSKAGRLTAVVIYISLVGLVYQFLLRPLWNPGGLQKIVDELLHTLIPLYVLWYWVLFAAKKSLSWKQIPNWSVSLVFYSCYILLRGAITGVYPYPFIDVSVLGYPAALLNTLGIFISFVGLSVIFILFGKYIAYSNPTS